MTAFSDEDYMAQALGLAEGGLGRVAPNPSVGCVIVKDGEVAGAARTADGGRPHAETQALEQAGGKAKGATVYVTLEPCVHHGRTLPCTDFLIAAQVKRVVVACIDQDKRVSGQGIKTLRDAGIEVTAGVLEREAIALNEGFFKRINNYRPMVTLKMATSIDSKIATGFGESQWITGEESRRRVHEERARHDAILTGIGTVLKDDPLMTARLDGVVHNGIRAVLDTHLRISPDSKLVATAWQSPVWIFTAPNADKGRIAALEKPGVKIIEIDLSMNGRVSLPFVLEYLAAQGVTRLMVEAGQKIFSQFLKLKVWDNMLLFRAPLVIGHGGMDAFGDLELETLGKAPRLTMVSLEQHGDDLLEIYRNAG